MPSLRSIIVHFRGMENEGSEKGGGKWFINRHPTPSGKIYKHTKNKPKLSASPPG